MTTTADKIKAKIADLHQKEVVLTRDLRAAIERLNPELSAKAVNEAIEKLTRQDFSRSALQHNQEFYGYIRNGVPVSSGEVWCCRHGRSACRCALSS